VEEAKQAYDAANNILEEQSKRVRSIIVSPGRENSKDLKKAAEAAETEAFQEGQRRMKEWRSLERKVIALHKKEYVLTAKYQTNLKLKGLDKPPAGYQEGLSEPVEPSVPSVPSVPSATVLAEPTALTPSVEPVVEPAPVPVPPSPRTLIREMEKKIHKEAKPLDAEQVTQLLTEMDELQEQKMNEGVETALAELSREYALWLSSLQNGEITVKQEEDQLQRITEMAEEGYKAQKAVNTKGDLPETKDLYRILHSLQALGLSENLSLWRDPLQKALEKRAEAEREEARVAEEEAKEKEFQNASKKGVYRTLERTWEIAEELVEWIQETFPAPDNGVISAEARLERQAMEVAKGMSELVDKVLQTRRKRAKNRRSLSSEEKEAILMDLQIIRRLVEQMANQARKGLKPEDKVEELEQRLQKMGDNLERVQKSLEAMFLVAEREEETNVNRNQTRVKGRRNEQNQTRRKRQANKEAEEKRLANKAAEEKRRANEVAAEEKRRANEVAAEEKRRANEAAAEEKRRANEQAAKNQEKKQIANLTAEVDDLDTSLQQQVKQRTESATAVEEAKKSAVKYRLEKEQMERKYAAMTVPAARRELDNKITKADTDAERKALKRMTPEQYIRQGQAEAVKRGEQAHAEEARRDELVQDQKALDTRIRELRSELGRKKEDLKALDPKGYATRFGRASEVSELETVQTLRPVVGIRAAAQAAKSSQTANGSRTAKSSTKEANKTRRAPNVPKSVRMTDSQASSSVASSSSSASATSSKSLYRTTANQRRNLLRSTLKTKKNTTPSRATKNKINRDLEQVERTKQFPATSNHVLTRLEREYGVRK
jgi:hypothetical protein